jgi:NAD(P)H-hydrate repair Nnr-like enzyme with NAD(P)H-hydrate dehydratase domain
VVLTPHDGEYATLLGEPPGDDRIAAANRLVAETGAVVLLKGPTTVVAGPDGRTWLVDVGDERLATAGSGDVLSGIIGAFLAAGVPALSAAVAAAFVHGSAALRCAPGTLATDIAEAVAPAIAELLSGEQP